MTGKPDSRRALSAPCACHPADVAGPAPPDSKCVPSGSVAAMWPPPGPPLCQPIRNVPAGPCRIETFLGEPLRRRRRGHPARRAERGVDEWVTAPEQSVSPQT